MTDTKTDRKEFLTRVHNLRANILKRIHDGTVLAGNHAVDEAAEEFSRDAQLLKEFENVQHTEEKFLPKLKRIIREEIHQEEALAKELVLFVRKHDQERRETVLQQILTGLKELEKEFEKEDAALQDMK